MTDEHYERVKMQHQLQELDSDFESHLNEMEGLRKQVEKKVDTDHFIDELDYFKNTTSQVNAQFNDALSEVSANSKNHLPDPTLGKIKSHAPPVRGVGMNRKDKDLLRSLAKDLERV